LTKEHEKKSQTKTTPMSARQLNEKWGDSKADFIER